MIKDQSGDDELSVVGNIACISSESLSEVIPSRISTLSFLGGFVTQ